jgi:branched-chain amino acid transport system substrate-binding protein
MKRTLFALIAILAFSHAPAVADARKISIGVALALTGNAAPFGTEELRGAQLAVSEINSKGNLLLDLKVEDTSSTGTGTVSAIKKLTDINRLKLILGPTWLDSFQGALPIAQRYGALLLTPSAGVSNFKKSPTDYPLVFSTYFNFEREIVSLIENGANSGVKKLAILFDQDPYFQAMRSFARDSARHHDLSIVFDQDFASGERDFRVILQRLQAQKPDAVVFGSVDEASVLSFLKQRLELAASLRVLGTHDLDGYASNKNFVGLLKNTDYIVPADPSVTFKRAYQERFKSEPLMSASNAYDAVMILATALNSGAFEPEAIAKFLRQQQFVTATFGKTRFSAFGGIENGDFIMKKGS